MPPRPPRTRAVGAVVTGWVAQLDFLGVQPPRLSFAAQRIGWEEGFVWGVAMGIVACAQAAMGLRGRRTGWPTDPVHPPLCAVVEEGEHSQGQGYVVLRYRG